MKRTVLVLIALLVIVLSAVIYSSGSIASLWNSSDGDPIVPVVNDPFPQVVDEDETPIQTPDEVDDEDLVEEDSNMITLPVRVHLMQADSDEIDAITSKATITALFKDVNEDYWAQAGIKWELESIVEEQAVSEEEFLDALEAVKENPQAAQRQLPIAYRALLDETRALDGGFNIYVTHTYPGNGGGVFTPNMPAVLIPEVSEKGNNIQAFAFAHELGHALTLAHYSSDPYNLMAVGDPSVYKPADKVNLTAAQITAARAQAVTGSPYTVSR